jgi:hypothetical protein
VEVSKGDRAASPVLASVVGGIDYASR